jgi:phosphate transport system permease protein
VSEASHKQGRAIDARSTPRLAARYAAERASAVWGSGGVILGLGFVVTLFAIIVSKGYTAFQQTHSS